MFNYIKSLFGFNKVHNAVMRVLKRKIELAEIELKAELKSLEQKKNNEKKVLVQELVDFIDSQDKKLANLIGEHKIAKVEATEKVVNRLLAKIV